MDFEAKYRSLTDNNHQVWKDIYKKYKPTNYYYQGMGNKFSGCEVLEYKLACTWLKTWHEKRSVSTHAENSAAGVQRAQWYDDCLRRVSTAEKGRRVAPAGSSVSMF